MWILFYEALEEGKEKENGKGREKRGKEQKGRKENAYCLLTV
jgi:hypothetical protein